MSKTCLEAEPPDLIPPVSPSAARTVDMVNERLRDGDALASLTTCVRSILIDVQLSKAEKGSVF